MTVLVKKCQNPLTILLTYQDFSIMPLKQRYRKLVPKLYRKHCLTNKYNIFKLNKQKFFGRKRNRPTQHSST